MYYDDDEEWSGSEEAWDERDLMDELLMGYNDDTYEDLYEESPIEEVIDMDEYLSLARRKLIFMAACTLGDHTSSNMLLCEAELYMHSGDYSSALTAAIAADLVVADTYRSNSREAIECICLYQMGSRSAAIEISDRIEASVMKSDSVSAFLKKRFANTVEVLKFMPQLLGMLSSMKKEPQGRTLVRE
jgi:hypothetical protein